MDLAFQLVLLPGLGADARLLDPQRAAFPQLIVPPWLPPHRRESLSDYAARMAETIRPRPQAPWVLGGVSFGGMLAYEMSRHLKPDAVVLIASCRTRRGLRGIYRAGRPLLSILPAGAWDVAKWFADMGLGRRSRISSEQRSALVTMFREQDSRFMHWVLKSLLDWRPSPSPGAPIFQIHGRYDHLIPAGRVEADSVISGGHLINVAHAGEVNEFIRHAAEASRGRRDPTLLLPERGI